MPARLDGKNMTDTLRFILCADDFALTPGVSQGIVEALEAGVLSATGAMTTRPFWREGARMLAPFIATADLGLHLNLTLGAPLTAMPGLAPSAMLPPLRSLLVAALARRLPQREVEAEIGAQIDAYCDAMGRAPDFVDGHQHVHVLPGVRDWLLEALAKRGLAGATYVRDSGDGLASIAARKVEAPKAAFVAVLARGFRVAARARGFGANQGFAGFSGFAPRRDYGADFARYLLRPGARHLVMCHPGRVDAELSGLDPATASREAELDWLLSQRHGDALAAAQAQIVRMRDLA